MNKEFLNQYPPEMTRGLSSILDRIAEEHGSVEKGLSWLAVHLNSETLDLWSRAWAANNNVNNYEIENLPFPKPNKIRSMAIQ